jgi:hypothetical protein
MVNPSELGAVEKVAEVIRRNGNLAASTIAEEVLASLTPTDLLAMALTRDQIEQLLEWTEGDRDATDCREDDGDCLLCETRDLLDAALKDKGER